ncbi:MAG: protein translocase subunit SecF [Proteobacteria bacterium]|nr:protein translocase subunit SecF [Pseudomonadota bacterium]
MAQLKLIKPNTKIPFIKHHKPFTFAILALAILGVLISFVITPNWGTSFRGGTAITMSFLAPVSPEEVRTLFEQDPRFESISVQRIGKEEENRYIVRTRTTTTLNCAQLAAVQNALPGQIQKLTSQTVSIPGWPTCNPDIEDGIRGDFFITLALSEEAAAGGTAAPVEIATLETSLRAAGLDAHVAYDETTKRYLVKPVGLQAVVIEMLNTTFGQRFNENKGLDEIVTVGADVGDKFRNDAILSVFLALGMMLLYIAIRFDTRYAPAAVISFTATALISFGILVVFQMEITLETVAAILSVVGYSTNDTIVNFDRIRENLASSDKDTTLAQVVNRSINECLSRTIITSLTTMMAIAPMAILATGATRDFAIIMCIGVVWASINSIFISCPLLLYLDEWFKRYQSRAEARKTIEHDLTTGQ